MVQNRTETKRFLKVKVSMNKKQEEHTDKDEGDIHLKETGRMFSMITTEIHGARKHSRNVCFEEIGYALTLWCRTPQKAVLSFGQPHVGWSSSKFTSHI